MFSSANNDKIYPYSFYSFEGAFMAILDLDLSFSNNIELLNKALAGFNDPDIENSVIEDAAFMEGTGNALNSDHITLFRAVGYKLISNDEKSALMDLFVHECGHNQGKRGAA